MSWQEGSRRGMGVDAPEVPGFEVGTLLGAGASASVWSAVRSRDGALVALKVVRGIGPDAVESASRELGVLGRVASEHVLRVHDAIALDGGDLVLVLDLMPGGSLRAAVGQRGHLTPGEVVTVLSPVSSALGRLHAVGVSHGDLSPGNVLLDRTGRPVIADLGTARVLGEAVDDVHGTEGFVAPEVLAGTSPGPAADVYAVGALGWLCLTGSVPGPGPLRGRLADALPVTGPAGEGEGEGAEGLTPGYDRLVAVLESCLAADPAARPTADEAALAVFDCASPEPLRLVAGGDDVGALTHRIRAAAGRPRSAPGRSRGRHRGRPAVPPRAGATAWSVGILLLVVLGVAGTVLSRREPAAAAPSSAVLAPVSGAASPSADGATDPVMARAAPATDPSGLMTALSDRRARAWREGLAALLADVDAPGSPALRRDTAALSPVQVAGLRYTGLRLVVASAVTVSAGPAAATVRARVDSTAYVVVGPGRSQPRAAATGASMFFDLAWTDAGWRVAEVRAEG